MVIKRGSGEGDLAWRNYLRALTGQKGLKVLPRIRMVVAPRV